MEVAPSGAPSCRGPGSAIATWTVAPLETIAARAWIITIALATHPIADRARAERAQARLLARRRAAGRCGASSPGLAHLCVRRRGGFEAATCSELDDDESAAPAPSLSDNQSSARAATDDDAKKRDRAIAEAIPTDADQLFKATVDLGRRMVGAWEHQCPPSFSKLIMLAADVGGARDGRRPGQVKTVGRQKNRRVSGGRRTAH